VLQVVDRSISKYAVAIEGEGEELARRQAAARRLYAAVLAKSLFEYGGQDVGVIVYKSTRQWIEANCFVPPWLKLFHHGDVTGTNALQNVRALFVIGRPLASAEAVTRMTEALFGDYIAERVYRSRPKQGRIPIDPDAAGNNVVLVDVWEHADPRAERLRRQVTEAALLQAVGRARAGLRGPDQPLDIHLWTDVPLPELGPVEPVLWSELEGGLEALMMATGGVWLESVPHAAKAYPELFTADTLKKARQRARARSAEGNRRARAEGVQTLTEGTSSIRATIGNVPQLHLSYLHYQRPGQGRARALAVSMLGFNETKVWLEARLGMLPFFVGLMPSIGGFFGRRAQGPTRR
jgi:hypothetical protein